MAITTDPFLRPPSPISEMTPEEKRMAEIERRVAEQIEKQRGGEVGRRTFAKVPGAVPDPFVKPERFNIIQDTRGNYWNRIQRFAGGPLVIERLRSEYTPADQRKIEKLYRDRSAYATDPNLNREERQAGMDKADAMISRVPKMPPIMREPTAQQKVDANTVAVDGVKYFYDGKSLKPIDDQASKARAELEKERRTRRAKINDDLFKANEAALGRGDPSRSIESINAESDMRSQIEFGLLKPAGSEVPQLDPVWQMFKSELDDKMNSKGRASENQMKELMGRYTFYATNMRELEGITVAEAKYDFLQRWQKAIGDGDPIVAKMSPQTRRRMWSVAADTIDPQGIMRQSISAHELPAKPIPPGMEAIWDAKDAKGNPILTEEVKTDIQSLLMEGKTVPQILAMLKELGMI